ncbi:MAG: CBS domain-containing protein [Euryarchaeota archaeon]|nr:CBS domain-containing protein [Euryarchaeota archaeon]
MVGSRKVREFMTRGIISVGEDMDIKEASEVLATHNISGAMVVDASNKPIGVISGIDIARTLSGDHTRMKVRDIMSRTIYAVDPDTTLKDAAKVISENRVHRLFVDPDGQGLKKIDRVPLGIITTGDIIRELAKIR